MKFKMIAYVVLFGLTLAAGCCTMGEPWNVELEGYDNIYTSKAPRDGEYGLWKLPDKRFDWLCIYKSGSNHLVGTVFLHKNEKLGFRKTEDGGKVAYAGEKTWLLYKSGTYAWRLEITDEDKGRITWRNFWLGFFELSLEILSGF